MTRRKEMEMDSTSSRHSPRSGNKLDGWASATPNPATMPPVIQSRKMAIKLILEAKDDMPLMSPSYSMTQNYGGKLHDDDAAVKETTPHVKDRRRFQASLQEIPETLANYDTAAQVAKGKSPEIHCLHFGISAALAPWYSAPFPAEYYTKDGQLWMCEWCLKYIRCQKTMRRHIRKCAGRPPPGNEIYRHNNISVFEINGRASKYYCQNLCLLAKMFLDHKTLYYDVETFLFYVLVEWNPIYTIKPTSKRKATLSTYSFVGYFSKEKQSPANYNLSCIMTLPNHQRKGYGHFLIDFSYLLSRKEGKRCSPEKPLSDLGLISYSSYWCYRVMHYLDLHQTEALSVEAISNATGMTINDVLAVLEHYGAIRWNPSRTIYEASLDASVLSNFREKAASKTYLGADSKYLRWVPLTSTR